MDKRAMLGAIMFGLSVHADPPALQNCGNTCFLNASLQVLYNMDLVANKLISGTNPYKNNIFGYNYTELFRSFNKQDLVGESAIFDCNSLLKTVDEMAYDLMQAPQCSQQDADEFLRITIGALIEKDNFVATDYESPFIYYLGQVQILSNKCPLKSPRQEDDERLFILPVQMQDPATYRTLSTLRECFDSYYSKEIFTYTASDLNPPQIQLCERQFHIKKVYDFLLVNVKRWKMGRSGIQKLHDPLYIPEQLNISDFMLNQTRWKEIYQYELTGVIVQEGSLGSGHYWAYVKRDGQWFKCNDDVILKVEWNNESFKQDREGIVAKTSGYVFLYKKKAMSRADFEAWEAQEQAREKKAREEDLKARRARGDFLTLLNDLQKSLEELVRVL